MDNTYLRKNGSETVEMVVETLGEVVRVGFVVEVRRNFPEC